MVQFMSNHATGDALANADAGLRLRVKWVKKLRAELQRLAIKYPQEWQPILAILDDTKEWL